MKHTTLRILRTRYGTSMTVGKRRDTPGSRDKIKICRVNGVPDETPDQEVLERFKSYMDLPLEIDWQ